MLYLRQASFRSHEVIEISEKDNKDKFILEHILRKIKEVKGVIETGGYVYVKDLGNKFRVELYTYNGSLDSFVLPDLPRSKDGDEYIIAWHSHPNAVTNKDFIKDNIDGISLADIWAASKSFSLNKYDSEIIVGRCYAYVLKKRRDFDKYRDIREKVSKIIREISKRFIFFDETYQAVTEGILLMYPISCFNNYLKKRFENFNGRNKEIVEGAIDILSRYEEIPDIEKLIAFAYSLGMRVEMYPNEDDFRKEAILTDIEIGGTKVELGRIQDEDVKEGIMILENLRKGLYSDSGSNLPKFEESRWRVKILIWAYSTYFRTLNNKIEDHVSFLLGKLLR